MNAEWYKDDNNKSAYYFNARELWRWILKYSLKSVFFTCLRLCEDKWGNKNLFEGKKKKKKAALECTVVAHRTTNKTTNTCMKREEGSDKWKKAWTELPFVLTTEPKSSSSSSSHIQRSKNVFCGDKLLTSIHGKLLCNSH